jgi:hypothetical protein
MSQHMNPPPIDIQELSTQLCHRLWLMNDKPSLLQTLLLVPRYPNGTKNLRFSEQEARFAVVQLLNEGFFSKRGPIYYSVETPTVGKYNFQNKMKPSQPGPPDQDLESTSEPDGDSLPQSQRSALTDMSLYRSREEGVPPFCNIEFKAGVASLNAIYKDIVKLSGERRHERSLGVGWFFHLINHADRNTFKRLYENSTSAMLKLVSELVESDEVDIAFTYCVLTDTNHSERPSWSASAMLHLDGRDPNLAANVNNALSWMKADDPITSAKAADWICEQYS